jgi:hypothetical protein
VYEALSYYICVSRQVLMANAGLLQHLVQGILNAQGSGNLQVRERERERACARCAQSERLSIYVAAALKL